MTKSLARLMVPLLVAAGLASGCGISSGPVVTDHAVDKSDTRAVSSGDRPPHRRNLQINSAPELVTAFLRASASEEDQVMQSYVADGEQWKPNPGGNKVVRVIGFSEPTTGDEIRVTLTVQHIGTLDDRGQLIPSSEGVKNYEYKVVDVDEELMLRDPPKDRLLSESGLFDFYSYRSLHFRSGDDGSTDYVLDGRYVSKSLSLEAQSNQLIAWLYAGPAGWLANAAQKLPPGTQPGVTGVVRGPEGTLVVDLLAAPEGPELDRLADQLLRTLVAAPPIKGIEIKVQGQSKITKELQSDARVPVELNRYAVVDGKLRRVSDSAELLPEGENVNVVAAAFARKEAAVAVVQQEGGAQRLKIGTRVALRAVELPRVTRISQPVWLDGGSQALVLADQVIYQIGIDGKAEPKLRQQGLTAMSVGPDKRSLALVIGGQLHLVSRSSEGSIDFGSTQSYKVPTMFETVQNVAFSGRNQLIVAGTEASGRVRLLRMNADGTLQSPFQEWWQSGWVISQISADPFTSNAMFQLQTDAYQLRQNGSEPLANAVFLSSPSPNGAKPKVSAPSFEN